MGTRSHRQVILPRSPPIFSRHHLGDPTDGEDSSPITAGDPSDGGDLIYPADPSYGEDSPGEW